MNGTYRCDGALLSFNDTGAGLPVVFLHPTPLDRDYWRPLREELGGVRAIVPDLRGHGASEAGSGLPVGGFDLVPDAPAIAMAQYAADITALLDHLKLQRAVFCGSSIGGYILLELWRQAPSRMSGMAFVCSRPQPDSDAARQKRAASILQIRERGTGGLFDAMAQSLTGASARKRRPELSAELRARMTVSAETEVAVLAGLAARPDSTPTVATIDVPALAIAGGEDTVIAAADMRAFEAAPGGCEFHLIPDAGHFAAYEQPHKVAALLADWIRQLEG